MHPSRLAAAVVVYATLFAGIGSLVTLATSTLRPATLVVLALVVLCVVGASALGSRSRRWLSNPYW